MALVRLPAIYAKSSRKVATIDHGPTKKIFELRRYTVKPNAMAHFYQCFEEYCSLRTEESKLVGYWANEIGSKINQYVHLWEYENLEQRAKVRATLAKKESWQTNVISNIVSDWDVQENSLLYMPQWYDSVKETTKKNGVFELVTYKMVIGGPVVWGKQFRASVEARSRLSCADLIGVWYTEVGEQNTVYTIWRYDSYQKRDECKELARNDAVLTNKVRDDLKNVLSHSTLIMLPTSWSPLQ